MRQLDVLQDEVYEWSLANFGQQLSPFFNLMIEGYPPEWPEGLDMPNTLVSMGSLAPLMGIVEEMGELFESKNDDDAIDAMGDIIIYLCDYAAREKFTLPWGRHATKYDPIETPLDPMSGIVVHVGKLYHATLKRHQGIREWAYNESFFNEARNRLVALILAYISKHITTCFDDKTLLLVANQTWNNVVSKRDWKKAPEDGGGHDHHDN